MPIITGQINELSDRASMGLPDHYVQPRFADLARSAERLRGHSREALADRASEAGAPIEERLAAGTLLAILGDPRIDPGDPSLVEVPAGRAPIGLDPSRVDEVLAWACNYGVQRAWIEKECPRFSVPIARFFIGRYPVTNVEYERFLIDTKYPEIPTSWPYGKMPWACANHPVYTVTAGAADAYASWLAARTGRPFRLPTEIEWEYAAAGPQGATYPWGEEFDAEKANTMESGLLTTSPVGILPGGVSWCGALDMAGNVEEFVASTYSPYPGGRVVEDDLYRLLGRYRIARGGAFNRFRDLARNQRRHGAYPRSLYAIGFRLAHDG
jgi:formylglycine-generating enzyme required for sulfatase activity